MRGKIIVISLVAVLGNGAYAGNILRCTAANGDVMFTNMACPVNSKVQQVASYEPVPDSPPLRIDPAASAAAASARQAREAAQQATAAAYEAQRAYEQAAADLRDEQSSGNEYPVEWYPYYIGFGSNFRGHHHDHHGRHDMVARSAQQPPPRAVSGTRRQNVVITRHR